jgi:hypothetical protein
LLRRAAQARQRLLYLVSGFAQLRKQVVIKFHDGPSSLLHKSVGGGHQWRA